MPSTRRPKTRRGGPADKPAAKDAFFVQVAGDSGVPQYFNITERIGRTMPFQRPIATVAMRATGKTVAFSLLMVSNKARKNVRELTVDMPESPLARLLRKSRSVGNLTTAQLVVEVGSTTYPLELERDASGCVAVSHPAEITEPAMFEIPRGGPKVTIFLKSPTVDRVLAVSSMGARYPGKPGSQESVVRAVSMVLFSLSQLLEFRMLSGIETVDVPAAMSRWADEAPTAVTPDENVSQIVPVWLFAGDPPAPAASGHIRVSVDLHNANPSTGRLLLRHEPHPDIAASFEAYRTQFDKAVGDLLVHKIGDVDLADMTYSVVLGQLDEGAVERIREALEEIAVGIDLAADRYRVHGS